MNYVTILKEHLSVFWYLRKIRDAKFVRYYFKLFLGWAAMKILDKTKLVLDLLLESVSQA
jgi:hypothetical protein